MAARLLGHLASRGQTLATCESLTGGGCGALLTEVPGASRAYLGGLITYASRLKHELAGVDAGLIEREGVVNRASAEAMAIGARAATGADWALACTGVAGPDPQDGHPVGTVWVAVASADGVRARELRLGGDRERIRQQTVTAMLGLLDESMSGE